MPMSTVRIPFSLSVIWAVHVTMTAPQPPARVDERAGPVGWEVSIMPLCLKVSLFHTLFLFFFSLTLSFEIVVLLDRRNCGDNGDHRQRTATELLVDMRKYPPCELLLKSFEHSIYLGFYPRLVTGGVWSHHSATLLQSHGGNVHV